MAGESGKAGRAIDLKHSDIVAALVPSVSARLNRKVTAWEIDHALWLAGRKKAG